MTDISDSHRLDGLHKGMTAALDFVIEPQHMQAFADLSGDLNPLHRDAEFARDQGFREPVVYGGLLVAQLSRLIGMHLPGRYGVWHQLRIDFRQPLYVNRPARLEAEVTHVSEAVATVSLAFRIECGEELVAKGSAGIKLVEHD